MINITLNRIETLESSINEAFKQLRTNIQFCGDDIKTIAVTSCVANEGKTETTFNIARSLSEAGNRVLLVDCDIRKSVMANKYQASKAVNGLSHYLAGREALDNIVCQTNIKNFYMIFSGTSVPNPAELLSSRRFPAMIEALSKLFDYIIMDCPPLGLVIDAAIIAQSADGAVMVIENNRISYKAAQKVIKQLGKSGCRILGAVLNKAEREQKGYRSKYYGKYYRSYGDYSSYDGYKKKSDISKLENKN